LSTTTNDTRCHTSVHVSIRQHTSAYVSLRQHTSACWAPPPTTRAVIRQHTSAYVSIRPRTSAYVLNTTTNDTRSSCVCVCMCVCVCVCVLHTYVHTYIHTHTHTHIIEILHISIYVHNILTYIRGSDFFFLWGGDHGWTTRPTLRIYTYILLNY
jgi:hypothetical protein